MLLGFDGGASALNAEGGPLSSLRRSESQMIRLAIDYLFDRLANPEQPTRRTQVGCTIAVGATTRAVADVAAPTADQRRRL
jgi:DNA-binding LacI/PurR family transcriptional regulator